MRTSLAFSLLLAVSGCHFVQGSGRLQTQTRAFTSFHAVDLRGISDVSLVRGEGSISVTTDDNLLQYVVVEVKGDTLTVEERDPATGNATLAPTHGIKVQVSAPDAPTDVSLSGTGSFLWADPAPLTVETLGLHVDGTGSVEAALAVTTVNADLQGTGSVTLTGTCSAGSFQLSGTGGLHAFGLSLRTAKVNVSGTGSAEVSVADSLDAVISGTGSVLYRGAPTVTSRVSGVGSVRQSN
jgi:hypothetical protein